MNCVLATEDGVQDELFDVLREYYIDVTEDVELQILSLLWMWSSNLKNYNN